MGGFAKCGVRDVCFKRPRAASELGVLVYMRTRRCVLMQQTESAIASSVVYIPSRFELLEHRNKTFVLLVHLWRV
jgi:hypothetical protein